MKPIAPRTHLAHLFARLARPAKRARLKPATTKANVNPTASRLGGHPYLENLDDWPVCEACRTHLSYIGQINFREAACRPLRHVELATFFYCWNCTPWDGDKGWALLLHEAPKRSKALAPQAFAPTLVPHAAHAMSFESVASLPRFDQLERQCASLLTLAKRINPNQPDEVYDALANDLGVDPDACFTQVGGYPQWIQGDETPKPVWDFVPLMHFDSADDEFENMWGHTDLWGDSGLGYLFATADGRTALVVQSC